MSLIGFAGPTGVILLGGGVSIAPAQTISSTLLGTVTDPSGSAIAGANVTARNEDTGDQRSTTTDSTDSFIFPSLLRGSTP